MEKPNQRQLELNDLFGSGYLRDGPTIERIQKDVEILAYLDHLLNLEAGFAHAFHSPDAEAQGFWEGVQAGFVLRGLIEREEIIL